LFVSLNCVVQSVYLWGCGESQVWKSNPIENWYRGLTFELLPLILFWRAEFIK